MFTDEKKHESNCDMESESVSGMEPSRTLGVKSQAVVKFSAVHLPVKFNHLKCNTNLNLPPSNWLTTSDSSYGLHQALYQSPGFASFRMAHMFPDCMGDVDVVSDAENIKKLLKLPYSSKGVISMIVHKVGNTLLLDEFDIQKYLLRRADDDWKWLRTFILEQLMAYGEKTHNFCIKNKSREALQSKNLLSKFLYYSLKQSGPESTEMETQQIRQPPMPIIGPVLPEPKVEENVPDPKTCHAFNRNVLWTFEDIRMLIGTDMPIFGGPNRPCISLRLRDMTKPINVLTGIDYWLDNLMCNVPEVVMCYHLDGIVQKYEIIKTEDLPHLENSQFSPQVVRNVAQNILSFLKANATKSGHTYWLFKRRNDDVVKLYDLTTLCKNQTSNPSNSANDEEENQETPFTVPVAMLLYSVARNMKNSNKHITPKTAGNIRALLDNCIKLLPKEKYPQIVTSSHYILSDLHVPSGIDPKSPKFDSSDMESDTQSLYEEEEDDISDDEINSGFSTDADPHETESVAVKNICDTLKEFHFHSNAKTNGRSSSNSKRRCTSQAPSPLVANVEERCRIAIEHISAGLSCLKFFNHNEEQFIKDSEIRAKDEEKQRILEEEQNPNMALPFKPIPLPYESLAERRDSVESQKAEPISDLKSTERERSKTKKTKAKRQKCKDTSSKDKTETSHATPTHLQGQEVTTNFNLHRFGSWNVHLRLLLIEKASLTYATLAEFCYVEQKYGDCLRAIYLSSRCHQVVANYMSNIASQKSCLIGRAGDCFFQMAKNWNAIDDYIAQFEQEYTNNTIIACELEKDIGKENENDLIVPLKNVEHLMVSSCKCYETALECVDEVGAKSEEARHELLRRLGNVRNELGLKYMHWAQDEYTKMMKEQQEDEDKNTNNNEESEGTEKTERKENDPIYIALTMKSYDSLTRGIAAFTEVRDNVNLAFMFCNMGRFMRFRAHSLLPNEIDDHQKQKAFYQEAFAYYEKAHAVLGSRKCNAELWDLVYWELSTSTFIQAKQLQNCSASAGVATAELEREVLELLQKSLKLCDVEHPGARQILYMYRSCLVHRRIASFHYSQLRRKHSETGVVSKTTLQLCKYHYEKAVTLFESLKEDNELLVVQLERISLQEFLTENATNILQKVKYMQAALTICLNCKPMLENILSGNNNNDIASSSVSTGALQSDSGAASTSEELLKHLLLFESRLQFALKTLIKLLLTGKDPKMLSDLYKKMYMETLTGKMGTGEQNTSLENTIQRLVLLLSRLKELDHT